MKMYKFFFVNIYFFLRMLLISIRIALGLDTEFCFNPGVANVTIIISLFYHFFLQKSIYVIVVLAPFFLNKINRLDLRKIVFFSLVALDFALMKFSSQILLGIG